MFRYVIATGAVMSFISISIAAPDASKTYAGEGSVQETTYNTAATMNTAGTPTSDEGMKKDTGMNTDHETGALLKGNMDVNDTPKMPSETKADSSQTPLNTNPATTQDPANLDGVTIPGNGAMEGQNPMAHGK